MSAENKNTFGQRIGRVVVPMAESISRSTEDLQLDIYRDFKINIFKPCSINFKQGCYNLTFRPKSRFVPTFNSPVYRGTLRFEEIGSEIVVSADLYKFVFRFPMEFYDLPKKYGVKWGDLTIQDDIRERFELRPELLEPGRFQLPPIKRIPIYPRNKYYSYLQGVSAQFRKWIFIGNPCRFTFTFDEFVYQHPTTGFDGSFPNNADRRVRMEMEKSDKVDYYEGKLFEGDSELGSITLDRVSPYFRRAELQINRLEGAEIPQPITNASGTVTEDFSTIFASAGWQLSVTRNNNEIALPASLNGVQDPEACWSRENSHDLMDSLPGYDPSILDKRWKAYLISIPATLGCSRGRMFDNSSGDVNDIDREGAVTHSHDGYPSTDIAAVYGDAEDELQKDIPRAFLRSAAHEVGHTFNQIHQNFEGGSDNSIMTVTPAVSNVIDAAGDEFPDDIDLSFNATVRRHLIHLPDPAVRPGAMSFFSNQVTAPEADISFFDAEDLELKIVAKSRIKIGEPLNLNWSIINRSKTSLPVPEIVDTYNEIAHINVTSPTGAIKYIKPFVRSACRRISVSNLPPGKSVNSELDLFWSPNGFAFETPGSHRIELIVLWEIKGLPLGVKCTKDIWVDHPIDSNENEVASLMFNEEVGKLIAKGSKRRYKYGLECINKVLGNYPKHPACKILSKNFGKSDKK